MNAALSAGFADPVGDAQRCFRAALDAMARPGRVWDVPGPDCPSPLCAAAGAVVLALVDHETTLWLAPGFAAARDWIAFHTGAPAAAALSDAAFVLSPDLPALSALNLGQHEAPEASATVILQVLSLSAGRHYRLSGPGLRDSASLMVDGLPPDFADWWGRNRRQFPRGVDLILCAGNQLAALPRSVTVREA